MIGIQQTGIQELSAYGKWIVFPAMRLDERSPRVSIDEVKRTEIGGAPILRGEGTCQGHYEAVSSEENQEDGMDTRGQPGVYATAEELAIGTLVRNW